MKLPIFVARQWIRHRTANVNEYSARYSILDREFYVPAPEHLAAQSSSNRQGRGEALAGAEAARVLELLREDAAALLRPLRGDAERATPTARRSTTRAAGLARELARMNLPRELLHAVVLEDRPAQPAALPALRADAHAQYEIRVYADVIRDICRRWVPLTYEAFMSYRVGGAHFSEKALSGRAPYARRRKGRASGVGPVGARVAGAHGDAGPLTARRRAAQT